MELDAMDKTKAKEKREEIAILQSEVSNGSHSWYMSERSQQEVDGEMNIYYR